LDQSFEVNVGVFEAAKSIEDFYLDVVNTLLNCSVVIHRASKEEVPFIDVNIVIPSQN